MQDDMKEIIVDLFKLIIKIIQLCILILLCFIIYIIASIKGILTGDNSISFITPDLMNIVNIVTNIGMIVAIGSMVFDTIKNMIKKW